MSAEGLVQLSDEAASYLEGVMSEHTICRGGWCRCGWAGCRRGYQAAVELAIAGRLELEVPWSARPDLGRWP